MATPERAASGRMAAARRRGAPITFTFDGDEVAAFEGETIAAALWAAGRRALRRSSALAEPRGVYCAMGVCFECLVEVDGREVRACMAAARAGMVVRSAGPRGDVEPGGAV